MKKLFSKAKASFQDPLQLQPSQVKTIPPPSPLDLFRYRYHYGANLGSIFVLEQWLSGSMFPAGSPGGSELDAVSASFQASGLAATRARWEEHWSAAVSDADFAWLVNEAHCTSLRVPIGHFTLSREFCAGTQFEHVAEVYSNAWAKVKDLVRRARAWGVGVLLDFHAVPGGANGEAHSGTGSGRAELWGNRKNLELAKRCLVFIAKEVKDMEGVIGIQVCNEAVWEAKGMWGWYDDVISAIAGIDESMPIYISDGWNLGKTLDWCNKRNVLHGKISRNPVVVDTHRYFTFSDADRNQSPQQIISRISGELHESEGKKGSISDRGEAQIVVGEWSCVLDGKTWGRVGPTEKDGLVRQFGQAQCKKWEEKSSGSYFWTYKMDWMDGGEWGFVEQTKKGNITPPEYLALPAQEIRGRIHSANERRERMGNDAQRAHEEYWNRTSPGKKFEHHLYSEGWKVGFHDAEKFFSMRADGVLGEKTHSQGGDKIGCLEIWVKKRLLESGQRGEFVWEWDQGFRAGVGAFQECVGI